MESGLNVVAYLPALLLLVVCAALAFAYTRLRTRTERITRDHDGYMRVFDQANDGVFVLDFVNGRIHRANERARTMLGYSPEEFASKTIFDLHFPKDLDRSAMRIADAWSSSGLVYDDIPFRTARGEVLPVECSTKVTSYADKPAVVLYARDITERVRLKREVDEKDAEMRSGLRYAQGIQMGMLPSLGQLRTSFVDAFVIFKPRDIVSGDFHWSARIGDKVVVAAADCTGHGVPGALLSMTGIALLQQIIARDSDPEPALVLAELRTELLRALVHQEGEGLVRDGMNIGLLVYDPTTREARFSGALCPLYILRQRDGVLQEMKGDRIPVGAHDGDLRPFTAHMIMLEPGDRMFLASDGMADQFGGEHGKKLKSSGLRSWLTTTGDRSIIEQGRAIENAFTSWTGPLEQVDDVLLLGLQV